MAAAPAFLVGHPLHLACHLGAEGEVRALLRAGADCDGQVGDDAAKACYRGPGVVTPSRRRYPAAGKKGGSNSS